MTTLEVRELFRSSKAGVIAGCVIKSGHYSLTDGKVTVLLQPGDELGYRSERGLHVGDLIELPDGWISLGYTVPNCNPDCGWQEIDGKRKFVHTTPHQPNDVVEYTGDKP